MLTDIQIAVLSKRIKLYWNPRFICYECLVFFPKLKVYPNKYLAKYLISQKSISDAFAADVRAGKTVSFRVRSFNSC